MRKGRHSWAVRINCALPTDLPKVDIMRPGPWGNPYIIGVHGDRDYCVDAHEEYVRRTPELINERWRLQGCDLLCCCEDHQRCHGDLLLRLARWTPDQLLDWMLGFHPLDDL